MDPCTDPRHRQTWANMPKPRKRTLPPAFPWLTAAMLAIFLGLIAVKAIANAAHDAVQAENITEGW
jgi:hypothetical protein